MSKPPIRAESASLLRGVYLYTPYSQGFIDELKAMVPNELRLWESDHKRWYVFETYAEQAVRLARKYWPLIDLNAYDSPEMAEERKRHQQWRQSQSGYGQQQSNQYRQQSSGQWQPGASSSRSDYAMLFVTDDAPPEVIKAAYKALAIKYHPDRGGDTVAMQAVNAAFDRLKKAGKA